MEWATRIWSGVLVAVVLAVPNVRSSLPALMRSVSHPKIVLSILGLAAWLLLVVCAAARAGAWNSGLLKDTVAWFIVAGFGTLFAAVRAGSETSSIRRYEPPWV